MHDYQFEDDFDPDGYSESELESILSKFDVRTDDLTPLPADLSEKRGRERLSNEIVDERIRVAYDGRVERVGDYHGRFSHMRVKCNACGEEVIKFAQSVFEGQWLFCSCKRPKIKK